MKIYTRTGDKGSTGLFGGTRIPKSSVRLHAYGTVDELNACLGVVLSNDLPQETRHQLLTIQSTLFIVGADLATPIGSKASTARLTATKTDELEQWIDAMEETLPALTNFILPGGTAAAAQLHVARTVCRRAERWISQLRETEQISEQILPYMNRLSDYLFVAARFVNKIAGSMDQKVILRD